MKNKETDNKLTERYTLYRLKRQEKFYSITTNAINLIIFLCRAIFI